MIVVMKAYALGATTLPGGQQKIRKASLFLARLQSSTVRLLWIRPEGPLFAGTFVLFIAYPQTHRGLVPRIYPPGLVCGCALATSHWSLVTGHSSAARGCSPGTVPPRAEARR